MAASFDFKKRLGAGYFGEVWYAIDTGLDCEIALKCIPKTKIVNQKNFYQESQTLKAAEHPNIVAVREAGELADGRIYVSMEYLERGSLEDEAKGGSVYLSRAKRIMIDVLRGLEYAHSKGIAHRDIKPANILIGNSGEGKLSDFGLALPVGSKLDISYIKEYQYVLHLAPEVKKVADYDFLSDIYACGVTYYRLINGDSYLPSVSVADARQMAVQGKFPDRSRYRLYVPRKLRNVVNRAMSLAPGDRYQSPTEMRRAIEQIYYRLDWDEVLSARGTTWTATDGKKFYEIALERVNGVWAVRTSKGTDSARLRRVLALCSSSPSRAAAESRAAKILQDLTTGKA